MPRDFFPRQEAMVLAWSSNFSQKLNADWSAYGVSEQQATAYQAVHDTFAAAYKLSRDNSTRTPAVVVAKNIALKALEAEARMLGRQVRGTATTTAAQRVLLGLGQATEGKGSPIKPPALGPRVRIANVMINVVTIQLFNAESMSRVAKPRGAAGAYVFAFVGKQASSNIADWKFIASTTRATCEVTFPNDLPPGTMVWLCACWVSPTAERSPVSQPQATYLQYGVAWAA